MSDRIVLEPCTEPGVPLEAPTIRPDTFRDLREGEIAALCVWHGNEEAHLGDFFRVRGERAIDLRIAGDAGRVKHLGARMAAGRLIIEGNAGMHAGAGQTGGYLRIEGGADDWAGAEMAGGTLEIRGDTGDWLGGAYPGSPRGMTGGVLLVHGSAGAGAAERMRRGVIAIVGDAGGNAGAFMLAGSLIVFGSVVGRAGAGMRRGSIVVGGEAELLPTFRYACTYRPLFLGVYLRRLHTAYGFPVDASLAAGPWRRYNGDFTDLGRGEILLWNGG